MIRRPPGYTLTDTPFPSTTLVRSIRPPSSTMSSGLSGGAPLPSRMVAPRSTNRPNGPSPRSRDVAGSTGGMPAFSPLRMRSSPAWLLRSSFDAVMASIPGGAAAAGTAGDRMTILADPRRLHPRQQPVDVVGPVEQVHRAAHPPVAVPEVNTGLGRPGNDAGVVRMREGDVAGTLGRPRRRDQLPPAGREPSVQPRPPRPHVRRPRRTAHTPPHT